EHHSNILPWRELGAEIVNISQTACGGVDIEHLEAELKVFRGFNICCDRPLIGCFSAASNITGQMVDVDRITELLHLYGALAFWDYATAGPYVDIDMNPIYAMFLSPHKFVGGVQTPGILVAKKKLFRNTVPYCGGGGGSVFFVSDCDNSHRYLQEAEVREEAGTPSIVESIRAGLVFQLKAAVGSEFIMQREHSLTRRALEAWSPVKSLVLLGSSSLPRLPIFSFLVRHEASDRFLHHNFVCALLNDLFGIQARGGCACAGPYAQDLLGISDDLAEQYEHLLMEDSRLDRTHLRRQAEYSENEILRPGFVRLNLPFFMTDDELDFVLEAVKLVAEFGWKLLPLYNFNPETGEWRHRQHQIFKDRKWLGHISYAKGRMDVRQPAFVPKAPLPQSPQVRLELHFRIILRFPPSSRIISRLPLGDQTSIFSPEAESLRWFLLPSEAVTRVTACVPMPFTPHSFGADTSKDEEFSESEVKQYGKTEQEIGEVKPEIGQRTSVVYGVESSSQEEARESINRANCATGACLVKRAKTAVKRTSDSQKHKWHTPPKNIFKPTMEAIQEHCMLKDGDRVLVCLSGGKDSLSLLHTIRQYQFYAKSKGIKFDLGAVTVDPQTSAYDPSPLKPYLASLGIPYFYEEQSIMETAQQLPDVASICSFCSRMKRGRIYAAARREGYNVLALGQHLDDLAESFLMSVFHNGILRTMKASYDVQEGDLRVIRPFIHVREKDLRNFAEGKKLPIIAENCPACFEAPKERHRMKQLLAAQEVVHPRLFGSLQSAMKPILSISRTGVSIKTIVQNAASSAEGESDYL
ncbi:hypothetical protein CAPTEDRAFT_90010, partial [Capitella teleta]